MHAIVGRRVASMASRMASDLSRYTPVWLAEVSIRITTSCRGGGRHGGLRRQVKVKRSPLRLGVGFQPSCLTARLRELPALAAAMASIAQEANSVGRVDMFSSSGKETLCVAVGAIVPLVSALPRLGLARKNA